MVGHGDRAEPALARRREQHVDRGHAVVRVVGVHVQVDVDELALAQPRPQLGVPARRPPARRQPGVDRLGLVADAVPREPVARAAHALAERAQQLAVAAEPLELGGEHVDVAGLEAQAEVAVPEQLLVGGQAGHHGHGAGAERAHDQPGRGRLAERGGDHDVGVGEHRVLGRVLRRDDGDAVAHAAAQRAGRRGAGGGEDGGAPVDVVADPAQGAQEQPQRRALLLGAERDPERSGLLAGGALLAVDRGGAGPQQRVGGRERVLHLLARGVEGRRARVEAAEEQLHEAARHLGREHPLGGGVEGADVERARVAQRDRRRARRERLVHVDEVQRGEAEHLLDRAPDVDRRRRRLAAAVERQQLAHAEHADPAVGVEQRLGMLARGADQPARVAHELRRARWGEHEHAMTALGQHRRQLGHERVDLVGVLPGVRRDLGDGEALGHLRPG